MSLVGRGLVGAAAPTWIDLRKVGVNEARAVVVGRRRDVVEVEVDRGRQEDNSEEKRLRMYITLNSYNT